MYVFIVCFAIVRVCEFMFVVFIVYMFACLCVCLCEG